jgi:hypothetical protein
MIIFGSVGVPFNDDHLWLSDVLIGAARWVVARQRPTGWVAGVGPDGPSSG